MAHQEGPVKGLVVFVNDDGAESASYIVEPLHCTAAEYATLCAAGGSFQGTMIADTATVTTYAELTVGAVDSVTVTDSYVDMGDGATVTFTKTFTEIPITASSFSVTDGTATATDDGAGNLTGAGISAGTINYTTGALSVTFSVAPPVNVPITADFTRGV